MSVLDMTDEQGEYVYADQAVQGSPGQFGVFASFTPYGIQMRDGAYGDRIRARFEDPILLTAEITSDPHLHSRIKENLLHNLSNGVDSGWIPFGYAAPIPSWWRCFAYLSRAIRQDADECLLSKDSCPSFRYRHGMPAADKKNVKCSRCQWYVDLLIARKRAAER